jgi:hypothetical protein
MNSASPDAMIDRARAATGLSEFGSEHFLDYLRAWCTDLAADRLSDAGRAALTRLAQRNLETRLRIEETFRQHPEIADVRLPRIVRIGGFPRSGTTLLHQLMSLGAGRRALLRWELVAPLPPPEAATYLDDPRIAKVSAALDSLRGSELERMHWVEATEPEECTWGFFDLSGLLGRGCVSVMPHWTDLVWGDAVDHRPTYTDYRRLVQLLLWRNPVPPGGTLVLKSPADTDCLPEFLTAFPEASVVLIHRDPYRTMTSSCHITRVLTRPFLPVDVELADEEVLDVVLPSHARLADAMVELPQSHPDRVISVRYAELMEQPAAVVTGIARRLDLPEDESATRRLVQDHLDRQRHGARAAPPTGYSNFGLTPDSVHGDPSLGAYMAAFDIAPEHLRTTAPRT